MHADDGRVHLDVALDVAGEAIRGTVCDGVLPAEPFDGWLELMSLFEIARSNAKAQARSS